MGSGGTYIGFEVAKALGFSYVDREILHRAARRLKKDEASLGELEEGSSGFIENLFRTFALGTPETYTPKERPVYDRDLFNLESKIISDIVDGHNVVIMGRGGFHLLKGRPKTIHLFVHAPRDYRVGQVMEADRTVDLREAQVKVDESDRRRGKYIRDMTGVEWADARNYHITIDPSVIGASNALRMAIDFARTALGV